MPTPDDMLFGSISVTKYFAKPTQVSECLQIQATSESKGIPPARLGEIMQQKGYLTEEQVALILKEQERQNQPRELGTFKILEKLGEGGMGTVYSARNSKDNRMVALKVLGEKNASDSIYLSRFQREAKMGIVLDHPHIVRTLGYGEDNGHHFMVLEMVEGGDLEDRIRKQNKMEEGKVLEIIRDIGRALQYAFESKIVHRDIKPGNIMFDKDGTVKLSDFGVVKIKDPEMTMLTEVGTAVGTPHFISPEQAEGIKDIDIRADIYSLGATLYYAVTGQTPFEGATAYAIIAKHLSERPVPPDKVNPELSRGCTGLIERMMAKDRNKRYQTPGEMVEDVERVLRGESPTPPSRNSERATRVIKSDPSNRIEKDPAPATVKPGSLEDVIPNQKSPDVTNENRQEAASFWNNPVIPLTLIGVMLLIGLVAWIFLK